MNTAPRLRDSTRKLSSLAVANFLRISPVGSADVLHVAVSIFDFSNPVSLYSLESVISARTQEMVVDPITTDSWPTIGAACACMD